MFPSPTYSAAFGNVPGSIKQIHSQFFYNSILPLLALWVLLSAYKAYRINFCCLTLTFIFQKQLYDGAGRLPENAKLYQVEIWELVSFDYIGNIPGQLSNHNCLQPDGKELVVLSRNERLIHQWTFLKESRIGDITSCSLCLLSLLSSFQNIKEWILLQCNFFNKREEGGA